MPTSEARAPEVQVTLAELEADPHPALARMRAAGPAAWVPALGAWMVTGYPAAVAVLRDARTFTVDDPRFSTAKVVGVSMLSLDGAEHARHRAPFNRAFRRDEVHARLAAFTRAEASRLVAAIEPGGAAELRRAVAGPLAVAVMAEVLGLSRIDPARILAWYDGIVAAVQAEAASAAGQSEAAGAAGQAEAAGAAGQADAAPAGQAAGAGPAGDGSAPAGTAAFAELAASLHEVIARPGTASLLAEAAGPQAGAPPAEARLTEEEAISNAAVLMFGGIETTEGMIANALLHLLSSPAQLALVLADPGLVPAAVEESLRLEPAAAVVDRYATAGTRLGEAGIRAGDQVTVSIAGANRDPVIFGDPDAFDLRRPNAGRQLAFAHGPHFCLGAHLARLEAQVAVETVLARLPGLRLDPRHTSAPRGLVFRKPPDLHAQWDVPS
jgi:cytochrome P450